MRTLMDVLELSICLSRVTLLFEFSSCIMLRNPLTSCDERAYAPVVIVVEISAVFQVL